MSFGLCPVGSVATTLPIATSITDMVAAPVTDVERTRFVELEI